MRFQIEQGDNNSQYINYIGEILYELGYVNSPKPKLVHKSHLDQKWIYSGFYSKGIKVVPSWIEPYMSPVGLAYWIMQDGSRQKGQGLYLATNSSTYQECLFLACILSKKYLLKTSVIKTGVEGQWRISVMKRIYA